MRNIANVIILLLLLASATLAQTPTPTSTPTPTVTPTHTPTATQTPVSGEDPAYNIYDGPAQTGVFRSNILGASQAFASVPSGATASINGFDIIFKAGDRITVNDATSFYIFDGSAWRPLGTVGYSLYTPTPMATATPANTPTPQPTATEASTPTPFPYSSPTPAATSTPMITATPANTPTIVPTATPPHALETRVALLEIKPATGTIIYQDLGGGLFGFEEHFSEPHTSWTVPLPPGKRLVDSAKGTSFAFMDDLSVWWNRRVIPGPGATQVSLWFPFEGMGAGAEFYGHGQFMLEDFDGYAMAQEEKMTTPMTTMMESDIGSSVLW